MAILASASSPSFKAVNPGTNVEVSGMGILSERLPGASIGRKLRRLAVLGSGDGGARRVGEVTTGDISREGFPST